jgi:hypothetical protein
MTACCPATDVCSDPLCCECEAAFRPVVVVGDVSIPPLTVRLNLPRDGPTDFQCALACSSPDRGCCESSIEPDDDPACRLLELVTPQASLSRRLASSPPSPGPNPSPNPEPLGGPPAISFVLDPLPPTPIPKLPDRVVRLTVSPPSSSLNHLAPPASSSTLRS